MGPKLDLSAAPHPSAGSPAQAQRTYTFYVAAESDDYRREDFEFGPGGHAPDPKSIEVGSWPTEIEGPHGLAVISPDGEYWYLSLAHGQPGPGGSVVKYSTADDAWLGETEVGMFPATLAMSPSIGLIYVVQLQPPWLAGAELDLRGRSREHERRWAVSTSASCRTAPA